MKNTHYKERDPNDTVDILKNKLKKMWLQTEEILNKESKIGTQSLRVVFKGTDIGTNGKGVNKSYCLASAYAELFERYENNYINPYPDYRANSSFSFIRFPDEKFLKANELVMQEDPFLQYYFSLRNIEHSTIEKKSTIFSAVNPPDKFEDNNTYYLSLPFFNIKTKKFIIYHTVYIQVFMVAMECQLEIQNLKHLYKVYLRLLNVLYKKNNKWIPLPTRCSG